MVNVVAFRFFAHNDAIHLEFCAHVDAIHLEFCAHVDAIHLSLLPVYPPTIAVLRLKHFSHSVHKGEIASIYLVNLFHWQLV